MSGKEDEDGQDTPSSRFTWTLHSQVHLRNSAFRIIFLVGIVVSFPFLIGNEVGHLFGEKILDDLRVQIVKHAEACKGEYLPRQVAQYGLQGPSGDPYQVPDGSDRNER